MLTTVMLCGNTVMVYASETESAQTPESSETPESPDSQGGNNDDKNTGLDNGMQSNGNTLQDANAVSGPSVSADSSDGKTNTPEADMSAAQSGNSENSTPPSSEPESSEPESDSSGSSSGGSSSGSEPSDQYASDAWKDQIRGELNRYYSDLKILYKLSDEKIKRMDKIYNSAMSYMKNAGLTMSELTSYEAEIEGYLAEIAKENMTGTEKFLMLSNEVPILDVQYGEQTFVVLSLINLGKTDITDVVVTPTVSNDKTKWPCNIGQAYDAQTIQIIQAADNTTDAFNKRMDVGWYFNVRNDVLTGCYPLPFHATYYQNGALVETDITTYINVKGSDPKKQQIGRAHV